MENNFDYTLSNDFDYMYDKLRESYINYSKASPELKTHTFFSLQSLYECMSQCGVYDEEQKLKICKKFIKYVGKQSGINYGLDNSNGIRVVVRPDSALKQLIRRNKGQFH